MMKNASWHYPFLESGNRIILYDAHCLLCSRLIQFVLNRDRRGVFRFANLEGESGRRLISSLGLTGIVSDSVVLFVDGKGYLESTAAILILNQLGRGWKYSSLLLHSPEAWRNGFYRWVARNRYRWFGPVKTCLIPEEKLRSRFLE